MALRVGDSCIRVNRVESCMCFCIVRREISHIRLWSSRKCRDIYDGWTSLCSRRKGTIKGFQSIRFRLCKENVLASFKAIKWGETEQSRDSISQAKRNGVALAE